MEHIESKNLIVFSGALYDSPLWTNRQHISSRLADRGWKVLYVEPRLLLPRMMLGKFPGVEGKWRWLKRHLIPWRAHHNIWVVAQSNLIPGSRKRWWISSKISLINHRLFNAMNVRRKAKKLGFKKPTILIYDTEAVEFKDDFPNSKIIYDRVDDHRAQAGVDKNPKLVEDEEGFIAVSSAATSMTTESLRRSFPQEDEKKFLIPNAADVEAFIGSKPEPEDLAKIPHPRIGTVGALDAYKIDIQLLKETAEKHPEWQFVLVGPVDYSNTGKEENNVTSLKKLPNIHFLGPKTYREVPAYVHGFDVAIIPYRASDYNKNSFPLKFWEFMASGKPVIVSGLPALEQYKDLVSIVSTAEEFSQATKEALADPEKGQTVRIEEAKIHSWSERVNKIEQLLLK